MQLQQPTQQQLQQADEGLQQATQKMVECFTALSNVPNIMLAYQAAQATKTLTAITAFASWGVPAALTGKGNGHISIDDLQYGREQRQQTQQAQAQQRQQAQQAGKQANHKAG